MDPCEDPDDVLRAKRSREKTYMFDVAFDHTATQVCAQKTQNCPCPLGWGVLGSC